eukprot:3465237-Pleurochrysis_carterae.AAC.1
MCSDADSARAARVASLTRDGPYGCHLVVRYSNIIHRLRSLRRRNYWVGAPKVAISLALGGDLETPPPEI